jgi:hypothetical protein
MLTACGGAGVDGLESLAQASTPLGEPTHTIIFIQGETKPGQDMFVRGGLDHGAVWRLLGRSCTAQNKLCALPIRHRNLKNATTNPWKQGEAFFDWYGREGSQTGWSHGIQAEGTPADWTTNAWPPEWGPERSVANDGYGVELLNRFGPHYWMLDLDLDCTNAYADAAGNRWFELKTFITGIGWEKDIHQEGTPYASNNHFAQCGAVNYFVRDSNWTLREPLVHRPMGTYSDWTLPNMPADGFDSLDIIIQPENEPDHRTAYYYAHQFGFVGPPGGYLGIQSDVNGERAIFSLWNSLAADGPGVHVPFGHEGSGHMTTIDFQWSQNRPYRLRVERGARDADGVWWSAFIDDVLAGTRQMIGTIKIPADRRGIDQTTYTWVEFYGPILERCEDYEYSKVAFAPPQANNGAITALPPYNHLGVGVGVCPVRVTNREGWVLHENGLH